MNDNHSHIIGRLQISLANRQLHSPIALPKILAKSESVLYNFKHKMRSLFSNSNKEFSLPAIREEEATGAEIVDLELDSLSLPEATRAYINRRRQEVLEELTGKDYAEMFADAVARNLAEKALATSRLDPRDEDQHPR